MMGTRTRTRGGGRGNINCGYFRRRPLLLDELAGLRLTLKRRSGRPLVVTGRGLAYRRSGMPSFRRTVPMRAPPLLLLRGGVGAGRGM